MSEKISDQNLEKAMAAAFAVAERSRKAAGMKPRRPKADIGPGGRRMVGPQRYKVTMWLAPWEYLDMFEMMRATRFHGSVQKWAVSRVTSGRTLQQQHEKPRARLRAVG